MKENAYRLLNELKIDYKRLEHPPLFTCEDARKYRVEFDGVDAKNLFVHNKTKSKYYLVILPSYKRADLKQLQAEIGETRLSFGNESDLMNKLKACRGSVSLLNLANVENPDVTVLVDKCFLAEKLIGFHPNVNTETVVFNPKWIPIILNHVGAAWCEILLN